MTEHGVLYFVAKDVTDRRATEIEHAQAASLARAITDSVTDGLLVSDHDGAIVYVNPSGLAMLGYEAADLIGEDCRETVQDGEAFRRKDGSVLPVVSSSSPVPLASGAGSVVTFRDITAQQAAEVGVRRSDELHRILTANLPDTTVFLLDHDLRILIADGEAIRRLPWFDEALFRGRLVSELDGMVPDEVLELSLTTYRAALEGERGGFDFLSEGLTFSVQAVPVRGEDEGVESVLVVARDVTERTRAEQQIARHARQQKAVAELGRFALGTHDLASLMAEAVTTATSTLDVDGGGILELSEDGERLTIVAGTGLPDGVVGERQIPVERERERRVHPADRGADDRRRPGGRDALRAGSVPAADSGGQHRERPDPGPRPAVRGPRRARARARGNSPRTKSTSSPRSRGSSPWPWNVITTSRRRATARCTTR